MTLTLAMTLRKTFCRLLLWVYFAWLFRGILSAPKEETDCNLSNSEPVKLLSCPSDCSQNDNESFFNCTIGGLDELKEYEYSLNPKTNQIGDLLEPPALIDIRYQYVVIGEHWTGSIYINFKLPKAINFIQAEAVQLYFEGLTKGDYYTECPRHRIFEFHNYKSESTWDDLNPRNISYSCFYGVESTPDADDNEERNDFRDKYKKAYKLGLKSFPGRWIYYTVTINVLSPVIPLDRWIPTIAVSLNTSRTTLSVLVERVPAGINVQHTMVELLLLSRREVVKSILLDGNDGQMCEFKDMVQGMYIVKVIVNGVLNLTASEWIGETVVIDATAIPEIETMMGPVKIFSMVGGCVIGVTLLAVLAAVVFRQRICKKMIAYNRHSLRGFILHPFDGESGSRQINFVDKYKNLLEETCSCRITSKSKSLSKIKHMLQKDTSVSFAIVFYDKDCYDPTDMNESSYSHVLKEAINRRSPHFRIVPVNTLDLPSVITCETSVKWDDLETVFCRMYGIDAPHSDKKTVLSGKWRQTKTGKNVVEMFEKFLLPIERPNNIMEDATGVHDCGTVMHSDSIFHSGSGMLEDTTGEHVHSDCAILDPKEMLDMCDIAIHINKSEEKLDMVEGECPPVREYNRESSVHSIQADVHMDSINTDDVTSSMPSPVFHRSGSGQDHDVLVSQSVKARDRSMNHECNGVSQSIITRSNQLPVKVNNTSGLNTDTQFIKTKRDREYKQVPTLNECMNVMNRAVNNNHNAAMNGLHIDNQREMYERLHHPEGFPPPNDERLHHQERFPPQNDERLHLSESFPPQNDERLHHQERFPPQNDERLHHPERFPPQNERCHHPERSPPGNDERLHHSERFPPQNDERLHHSERFPRQNDERLHHPGRFPPQNDERLHHQERFPPQNDERLHHSERFPPQNDERLRHPETFPPQNDERLHHPERFPPQNDERLHHQERFPPQNDERLHHPERFPPQNDERLHHPERFPPQNDERLHHPERFPPQNDEGLHHSERFPPQNDERLHHPLDTEHRPGLQGPYHPIPEMYIRHPTPGMPCVGTLQPSSPMYVRYPHRDLHSHRYGQQDLLDNDLDRYGENSPLIDGNLGNMHHHGNNMVNHHDRYNNSHRNHYQPFQDHSRHEMDNLIEPLDLHHYNIGRVQINRGAHASESRRNVPQWSPQLNMDRHRNIDHFNHYNEQQRKQEQQQHMPAESLNESEPLIQSMAMQGNRASHNSGNKIHFGAVDPIPPGRLSRSRLSQGHLSQGHLHDLPHVNMEEHGQSYDDFDVDGIKSVSQENLNKEIDFVMDPPLYNHSSQESCASTELEKQLKLINENALADRQVNTTLT